jgi:hypothetical protein
MNLTGNGLKFTPRGGKVRVRLERSESAQGPELVVEVKDTGIGIAPAAHSRIFQPYVQGIGGQSSGSGDGAGLGLAIVRQLVGLMGGAISLQSRPGAGATFRVLLPLREPPDRLASVAPAAQVSVPAGLRLADDAVATLTPLDFPHATELQQILAELHPPAAATHSTADVQRLAEALARLGTASGSRVLAEEASRLLAASASFALTELDIALGTLRGRLTPLIPANPEKPAT